MSYSLLRIAEKYGIFYFQGIPVNLKLKTILPGLLARQNTYAMAGEIDATKKLFLLGGRDLEMLTIKQMLEGRVDCMSIDKHLRWDNASLSAYNEDLSRYNDMDIYGVELREDIPVPANYHRIDHHNDFSCKASSLEQVADLLDVSLSRYQLLVATNDKGYIPAMEALGATKEEIIEIRRKDRETQGVTEEEERLAEESIAEHLLRKGELLTVKSLTSKFSPICDRLYPYKRLLVYTDAEWMFYGSGKDVLVRQFENYISRGIVFHGGGDNGYIGCVAHALSQQEIDKNIETIKKMYE